MVMSFIVAFLVGGFSVLFLQQLTINSTQSASLAVRLQEINEEFPAAANKLIRSKFRMIDFLANSSYPAVAFQFNMGFQFSKIVQQFSDDENLSVLLVNQKGEQKAAIGIMNSESKKLIDVFLRDNRLVDGELFHTAKRTIYIKRTMGSEGSSSGFLVGILPRKVVETQVRALYFQRTIELKDLDPDITFPNHHIKNQEGVDWKIFFQSQSPGVDLNFLKSSEFLVGILALLFMAVMFSIWLRNQLQKPFDQISKVMAKLASSDPIVPEEQLPVDPKFREFAQKMIELRDKQLEFDLLSKETIKYQAISQTTQMLAHDVRKPFSMLKGLLNILETTKDPEKILEIATKFNPEIHRALASVNAMLADIMEIGSHSQPLKKTDAN